MRTCALVGGKSSLLLALAVALLTACGSGDVDEQASFQVYRNCRYSPNVVIPGGPWMFTCFIVAECDLTEPCLAAGDPFGCVMGQTTCTACPPNALFC